MGSRKTAPGKRHLPVGAEVLTNGVHFRVWAPDCERVEVVVQSPPAKRVVLSREPDGYFNGILASTGNGTLYGYSLDGGPVRPDPASRFQPEGPNGPSEVVDPDVFTWSDHPGAG